jgi:site-specific recombinase XerD
VQDAERKASTVVWLNKDKLVFTEPNGMRMADWNVRRHLYRILADAGLPRIKPHWLRHSFASVLLANGVALPVVSHQLRHANTGITARTYSHMLDEQVGVAGAAMTRAFGAK